MPIRTRFKGRQISKDEFYNLDYQVKGILFEIHNEFGPFCDEKIYKVELADRCLKKRIAPVQLEEPIYVSYNDFSKIYYIDLLFDQAVIYELKSANALNNEYRKQTINYLLLAGLNFGKLVNMGASSVQHEFVSASMSPKERYQYRIHDQFWMNVDQDSIWMKKIMLELISDWGAFLDTNLFYEAIEYYRGGKENVIKKVEIKKDERVLGEQKVHLLNPKTAFKISAVKKYIPQYEQHLKLFIKHTSLMAIQWINFNNHEITLKTILNR